MCRGTPSKEKLKLDFMKVDMIKYILCVRTWRCTILQEQGVAAKVYETLKDMILAQQIKPGEKIPESRLATQFGISRTPIREALKRLENDGIVTVYPNRYAEVTVFPQHWLQEVGLVRLTLDTVAAHLAILYGSNYDFSVMEELNEACRKATQSGNMAERIKMNCAFHFELSRISRNQELCAIQEKLYLKLQFVQACNYGNVYEEEEQYRQHCEMIRALYDRDEKRLVELLTEHLSTFHHLEQEPSILKTITSRFAPIPHGRETI